MMMVTISSSRVPSFLLIILLLSLSLLLEMQEALESGEGRALLQWKETLFNTDGVLDSWSHSNLKNLCNNWTGITCNVTTTATTYVSEINVRDYSNRLTGTLDHFDFISFPKLTYFVLSNNSFFESIPSAIANLSKLTVLDLSYNLFQTSIPLGITMLTKLRYLNLGVNNLNSTIPDQISHLHNLEYLNISWNSFSGQFPESMYSNLTNLQYFICFGNQIQGRFPTNLTKLSNLRILDLSYNNFYGSIPHEISGLRNLNELYLGWNNFSGVIPLQIGKLKNLVSIGLKSNFFSGPIPSSLWNMTNLSMLSLAMNNFSGTIPPQIGNLKNLKGIDLSSNHFSGPIIASSETGNLTLISSWLCNLDSLLILDPSKNNLRGPLPQCLWNVSNHLWFVDLSTNQFEGTIPGEFTDGNPLRYINLMRNHLGGPLPRGLASCSKLMVLALGNNNLVDSFPHWLDGLSRLGVLILRSNQFYGTVGTSRTISPFQKLHIFDISHNEFTGPLPMYYLENFAEMQKASATGGFVMLSHDDYINLMLKRNELPVWNFTIFTLIDLSRNHFHGEIPESIGKLHSIRFLNLSHNELTGYIPSSLGNLSILEVLDLSSNQLVGKIPQQLANLLTFLAVLDLSYNHLAGPIPHGPQFNTFSNDSYMGNTALCGFPLMIQCQGGNNGSPPRTPAPDGEGDSGNFGGGFGWRSVVIGYCSCMPFGIFVGYVAFLYGRPRWFVRLVVPVRTLRNKK